VLAPDVEFLVVGAGAGLRPRVDAVTAPTNVSLAGDVPSAQTLDHLAAGHDLEPPLLPAVHDFLLLSGDQQDHYCGRAGSARVGSSMGRR
jgi:hypothetical protein